MATESARRTNRLVKLALAGEAAVMAASVAATTVR